MDEVTGQEDITRLGSTMTKRWLRGLMRARDENRPVASVFVMGSAIEILRVFDFEVILPEVTALQSAVRKSAPHYLRVAEDYGYSPDVCNYVKADIGMMVDSRVDLVGDSIPGPDLVIASNVCNVYVKWAEFYEHFYGSSSFMLDLPLRRTVNWSPALSSVDHQADVRWVRSQLEDLIVRCEEITGVKFDVDRLSAVLSNVNEMVRLFREVLEINRHRPAPYDVIDEGAVYMGVMNAYRGTDEGVDYFRRLLDHLTDKVTRGEGCGRDERFRLAIDGGLCWMKMREMRAMFADRGGVFVTSNYPTFACGGLDAAGMEYDVSRPLESLAEVTLLAMQKGCNSLFFSHPSMRELVEDYQADGLVLHAIKSCRTLSTSMNDTRQYLLRTGVDVPALYIESDHMDERFWSEAQLKNRIDAFFEVLEDRMVAQQERVDMLYVAGIDVGSTQAKGVILDEQRSIVGRALLDLTSVMSTIAEDVFRAAVLDAGLEEQQIGFTVATGYGRYQVSFGDAQATEIRCHARGAHAMFPRTRTVLDIGGQDTKAILLTEDGEVADFAMNDKCAAGTGRFLAACCTPLEIELSKLASVAAEAVAPVKITTTCTVFAESEIIGHIAKGNRPEDVIMGMHESVAKRCAGLVARVGMSEEVTFTGGVSRNEVMVALLEELLGSRLNVSAESQHMGALGAALFALDRAEAGERGRTSGALQGAE